MYFRGPNTIIETRADYDQLSRMVLVAKLQYAMMMTLLLYMLVSGIMVYLFFSQATGGSIIGSPYMVPGMVIGIGLLVISSILGIVAFPKTGWSYIIGALIGLVIPVVYLVVIVMLSGQVSSMLRQCGFTIGFLGVSPKQIMAAAAIVKRGPPPPIRQQ